MCNVWVGECGESRTNRVLRARPLPRYGNDHTAELRRPRRSRPGPTRAPRTAEVRGRGPIQTQRQTQPDTDTKKNADAPNSHPEQHPRLVLLVALHGPAAPEDVDDVRLHDLDRLVSLRGHLERQLARERGQLRVQLAPRLVEARRRGAYCSRRAQEISRSATHTHAHRQHRARRGGREARTGGQQERRARADQ